MATNTIYIPFCNPVPFYQENVPAVAGKNFVHLDEDRFCKQILPWQQKVKYLQKWQQTDTVYLHVHSTFNPIKLDLVGQYDVVKKSMPFVAVPTVIIGQPWRVYEVAMQLADVPVGCYYFRITAGFNTDVLTFRSENIDLKLKHPGTVLHTYRNSINHLDVIYDTGIQFGFRCECSLADYDFGNESTVYTDQPQNEVTLSSIPFDIPKVYYGGSKGIPPWVVKKLNVIYSNDFVLVDGLQVVRTEGTKLEAEREDDYPMAGWSMEIRLANNWFSGIYDTDFNTDTSVVYNIENGIFGTMNDLPTNQQIKLLERK